MCHRFLDTRSHGEQVDGIINGLINGIINGLINGFINGLINGLMEGVVVPLYNVMHYRAITELVQRCL